MAKNNPWLESNEKAKVAEALAANCFSAAGWASIDVSGNKKYQNEDIDFILINRRTGEKATLECKSDDTYQYGNFAFESVKNTNTGDLGWALTTTAQYITIYYPPIDTMYLLDGPKMVAWFTENQHRFRERKNSTARREGGALYHSLFRIVNRELFARESGAVIDSFIVSDFLKEQAS